MVSKNKQNASEQYQQKLDRLKKGLTEEGETALKSEPPTKHFMTQRRPNSAAISNSQIAKTKPERQLFVGTNERAITSAIVNGLQAKPVKEMTSQLKQSLDESASQNDSLATKNKEAKFNNGTSTVKLVNEAQKLNSDISELIERSRKMAQETRKLFMDTDSKLTQSLADIDLPLSKTTTLNTTVSRDSVNDKSQSKNANLGTLNYRQPSKYTAQPKLGTDALAVEKDRTTDFDGLAAKNYEPEKLEDISLDDIIQTFDKLHNPPNEIQRPNHFIPSTITPQISKSSQKKMYSEESHDKSNDDFLENFEQIEKEIRSQFKQPAEKPKPIIKNPPTKTTKNTPNVLDFGDDDVINKFENLKRLIDSTKTDIKGLGAIQSPQPKQSINPAPVKRVSFKDELPNNPPKPIIQDEPEETMRVLAKAPLKRQVETKKPVKENRDSEDLFSLNLFSNLK